MMTPIKYMVLMLVMSAGLAHGQIAVTTLTNIPEGVTNINPLPRQPQVITNIFTATNHYPSDEFVKLLVENGDVCRVRGKHEWEFILEDKGGLIISTHDKRKCSVCGRKETKKEVWEEAVQ